MRHELIGTETLHEGFVTLRRARFRVGDEEITREVEDHGDAVVVLPYDPVRKVGLFVSLSRAPVIVRGVREQFLEAPAGMLDEDDPVVTAKRELIEEAGLHVDDVEYLGWVWSSPGVSTERMHLFVAAYSEEDRRSEGGGLADEHEDITVSEISLTEMSRRIDRAEVPDLKTLTLLLLLRARRPELFA